MRMEYLRERLKRKYSPKELKVRTDISTLTAAFSAVLPLFKPDDLFLSAAATVAAGIYSKKFRKLFEETRIGGNDALFRLGRDEFGRPVEITPFYFHRHMVVVGGTGMGKTSLYRTIIRQLLTLHYGIIYINFKAEDEDFHNLYFLCKELGVEKDLLVLNLSPAAAVTRETHTFSPLATLKYPQEIADFFFFLLAPAKGEMEYWQGRGRFLMNAAARNFCYLRDIKKRKPNLKLFLESFELSSIVEAFLSNDCPEEYKMYFLMYLQDLDPSGEVRKKGAQAIKKIGTDLLAQHGYALQQWKEIFSDISLRYAHIFDTDNPDIDMIDVIQRNRILYVHMPALKMPDKTKEAIGRLILASIRTATGILLGESLLGDYEELKEKKKREKPKNPFAIIVDEHGTAPIVGIDDYMRQVRSLRGGVIIADQNWDTLKEKYGEGYLNSILANSHTKIIMRVEGSRAVYDFFKERIPRVRKMIPDFRKREVITEEDERRTLQEDYLIPPETIYKLDVGEGIVIQGENFLRTRFDFYEPKKEGKVEILSYERSVVRYSEEILEILRSSEEIAKEKRLKELEEAAASESCVECSLDYDEEELVDEPADEPSIEFLEDEETARIGYVETLKVLAEMKRIDRLVRLLCDPMYEELSKEEKVEVAKVIFSGQYEQLPPDEELLEDLEELRRVGSF